VLPNETQGCADRISKLVRPQLVLLREDFDPLRETCALYLNVEFGCQMVDVDAGVAGEHWTLEEHPKVPATLRFL
jgi:hypothetical protein